MYKFVIRLLTSLNKRNKTEARAMIKIEIMTIKNPIFVMYITSEGSKNPLK